MAKVIIFSILCCSLMAIVKCQEESVPQNIAVDSTTLNPENQAILFKDISMKIITKQLTTANLTPAFQPAGQQILSDAQDGLAQCEENLKNNHIIWQYKVCATTEIRNALAAIRALQMAALKPLISAASTVVA